MPQHEDAAMNPPDARGVHHPRDEIVGLMQRIYQYRMTTTSGGNISLRDDFGDTWITPARIDKGSLTRDDIVCIHSDDTIDGRHKPSSEWPFHRAIYKARPDIRAVLHAHPVALVAFSICRTVPDTNVSAQAADICGRVGYAPYALPGSEALGERITEQFAAGADCVMLENHGVVIGGRDLQQAFQRFETLEFTAKTLIKANQSGTPRPLTAAELELSRRPRGVLPPFDPSPATSEERELRRALCTFIHRGYRQRLLTSTGGSFSARLDAESFLISAYNVDRQSIRPDELALIRNGTCQRGARPSRAVLLHQAIYQAYPNVRAIVNATPVNATAFAIRSQGDAGMRLDARTIPESYLFLAEVPTLPFASQFGDGREIAGLVSPTTPVALLENGGALILGKSILDAFDRLEVLESTAEALNNSAFIGPVQNMTDAQIAELRGAFGML